MYIFIFHFLSIFILTFTYDIKNEISEGQSRIKDIDFFQLVLYYLEERQSNNIYRNLQKDVEFLNATEQEQELCNQYENLNLTDEQRKVISRWIDAIHAQNCAYTSVVFRMAMQYGFSILVQLADLA